MHPRKELSSTVWICEVFWSFRKENKSLRVAENVRDPQKPTMFCPSQTVIILNDTNNVTTYHHKK